MTPCTAMQTGAGKTYTMSGESQQFSQRGVTPRALHQIFEQMDIKVDRQITVKVSFVEVYNEVNAACICLVDCTIQGRRMYIHSVQT